MTKRISGAGCGYIWFTGEQSDDRGKQGGGEEVEEKVAVGWGQQMPGAGPNTSGKRAGH